MTASFKLFEKVEISSDDNDEEQKTKSMAKDRARILVRSAESVRALDLEDEAEEHESGYCECDFSDLCFIISTGFAGEDELKAKAMSDVSSSDDDSSDSENELGSKGKATVSHKKGQHESDEDKFVMSKKHKSSHKKKKKFQKRTRRSAAQHHHHHHRVIPEPEAEKNSAEGQSELAVAQAVDVEPTVLTQEARRLRKKRGSVWNLHANEEEPNAEWELANDLMPVPSLPQLQLAFFKKVSHLAREGPFFATDAHSRTLLFLAVAKNDVTSVRTLLQVAQPNTPSNKFLNWCNTADESGVTPLELANRQKIEDASAIILRRMKLARREIRRSTLMIPADVGEDLSTAELARATNPVFQSIAGVARRASTILHYPRTSAPGASFTPAGKDGVHNHIRNVHLGKF